MSGLSITKRRLFQFRSDGFFSGCVFVTTSDVSPRMGHSGLEKVTKTRAEKEKSEVITLFFDEKEDIIFEFRNQNYKIFANVSLI